MASNESPEELRQEITELAFELGRLRGRQEVMLEEAIEQRYQEAILQFIAQNSGVTAEEIISYMETNLPDILDDEIRMLAELPELRSN